MLTPMRIRGSLWVVLALAFAMAACGSGETATTPGGDSSGSDAGVPEAGADSAAGMGGGGSAGAAGMGGGGSAGEAGVGGGGSAGAAGVGGSAGQGGDAGTSFEPDPACDYLENRHLALSCSGEWGTAEEMIATTAAGDCPTYFQVGSDALLDIADASALGCDLSCVYVAHYAALMVYCGVKGETTGYSDGGPGQTAEPGTCPELLHIETIAGSGWYSTMEAYEAEHPCP